MSASDKKVLRHSVLIYWIVSVFCGIFAAIYEHFSHGVYSRFMVLLFVWPLMGGIVPLIFSFLPPRCRPTPPARDLWGCGIATLTLGSCLCGIFDIYGTVAPLVNVFWYVGAGLLLLALIIGFLVRSPRD